MIGRFLFEIIPPPVTWEREKVEEWAHSVAEFSESLNIQYLNVPEVVNETTRGERVVKFIPKIDHLEFAKLIKSLNPKLKLIINKITPRIKREEFEEWFERAYNEFGCRFYVLVGGESSKINYPGYTVIEATEYVKSKFRDVIVGGITIFTRRNEVERIKKKMESGIEFFVSQIIFETENMKNVLNRLKMETGERMPLIHVSFAPALKFVDIEFMEWLGVEFDKGTLNYLMEDETKLKERTYSVIKKFIEEILTLKKNAKMNLGINLEHVMYRNIEATKEFLKEIKPLLEEEGIL